MVPEGQIVITPLRQPACVSASHSATRTYEMPPNDQLPRREGNLDTSKNCISPQIVRNTANTSVVGDSSSKQTLQLDMPVWLRPHMNALHDEIKHVAQRVNSCEKRLAHDAKSTSAGQVNASEADTVNKMSAEGESWVLKDNFEKDVFFKEIFEYVAAQMFAGNRETHQVWDNHFTENYLSTMAKLQAVENRITDKMQALEAQTCHFKNHFLTSTDSSQKEDIVKEISEYVTAHMIAGNRETHESVENHCTENYLSTMAKLQALETRITDKMQALEAQSCHLKSQGLPYIDSSQKEDIVKEISEYVVARVTDCNEGICQVAKNQRSLQESLLITDAQLNAFEASMTDKIKALEVESWHLKDQCLKLSGSSLDGSLVEDISDHIIEQVTTDPRVCKVVESQQSLQESCLKLHKMLDGAPPNMDGSTLTMKEEVLAMKEEVFHEAVLETQQHYKSVALELRQVRQRRNQDYSEATIRMDSFEEKLKTMEALEARVNTIEGLARTAVDTTIRMGALEDRLHAIEGIVPNLVSNNSDLAHFLKLVSKSCGRSPPNDAKLNETGL